MRKALEANPGSGTFCGLDSTYFGAHMMTWSGP